MLFSAESRRSHLAALFRLPTSCETLLVRGGHIQPFEYIAVLLSIVISFALAHLLSGIAHIIENGFRRFSIPLAHWIAFCLFLCVDYWFTVWHLRGQTDWTLAYVCQLLAQSALIYIASRLIVPAPTNDEPIDLSAFFDRHRRKLMGVLIVLAIVNQATNLTLEGFSAPILGYMIIVIGLFAVAWIWKSHSVQLAVAAVNVAMTAYYAVTFVPAL